MIAPLSARALRTRWAVLRLQRGAAAGGQAGEPGVAGEAGEARRGGRAGQGRQGGQAGPRGAAAATVHAMGLEFPTPLGLAAGFDRGGRLLAGARRLGLGAVEIGTLTAATGLGTPPRWRPPGREVRCGISIGKPAHLGWAQAEEAFLRAFEIFHPGADYLTLNPGRGCPSPAHFAAVVTTLARARDRQVRRRALPLVVKLPAAWLGEGRAALAAAFVAHGADGLLLSAEGLGTRDTVHACLAELAAALGPRVGLISVGGVDSAAEAAARLRAGAQLVQLHRALLGHGPQGPAPWPGDAGHRLRRARA